jgi:hypothetical protein
MRIDELLEGGLFATVQSKAYRTDFDQPVHDREEAGGLSVKGEKGEVGETWPGIIHEPSPPFPREPLTHQRRGATVR